MLSTTLPELRETFVSELGTGDGVVLLSGGDNALRPWPRSARAIEPERAVIGLAVDCEAALSADALETEEMDGCAPTVLMVGEPAQRRPLPSDGVDELLHTLSST